VIVVATMQAFRRKDMGGLNVYKNNGELMSHFENLPAELLDVLERDADGYFPRSLVNVFRLRRPFVIIGGVQSRRDHRELRVRLPTARPTARGSAGKSAA
jgi:hypothetical protein